LAYTILSKEFIGDASGRVTGVKTVQIDWSKPNDKAPFTEVPGSEKVWKADLIFLSMGFLGPEHTVASMLGVEVDSRSNYKADHGRFATNVPAVFAAGDCRRGQSLVVWAINEGRGAARAIDEFLMGSSALPAPG
jgi:NADPH-dependent glutamate synthase beta subunit-like oxidoreductase